MIEHWQTERQLKERIAELEGQVQKWKAKWKELHDQQPTLPPRHDPVDVLKAIADCVNEPMSCGHHIECWHEEDEICVLCKWKESKR